MLSDDKVICTVRSTPAWAMTGTEIDRKVCGVAFVRGARPLTLLSKDETHEFLDAKRVAGVKSKCFEMCATVTYHPVPVCILLYTYQCYVTFHS